MLINSNQSLAKNQGYTIESNYYKEYDTNIYK